MPGQNEPYLALLCHVGGHRFQAQLSEEGSRGSSYPEGELESRLAGVAGPVSGGVAAGGAAPLGARLSRGPAESGRAQECRADGRARLPRGRAAVASAAAKVVSLFEPHADVLVKDRRETYYGHKIFLTGGASGLILDCAITQGNPADATWAVPLLQRQQRLYGRPPRQASLDGGFASMANLTAAKQLGVADVSFAKRRGLPVLAMVKSSWVYRKLRAFPRRHRERDLALEAHLRARPLPLERRPRLRGVCALGRARGESPHARPTPTGLSAAPHEVVRRGRIPAHGADLRCAAPTARRPLAYHLPTRVDLACAAPVSHLASALSVTHTRRKSPFQDGHYLISIGWHRRRHSGSCTTYQLRPGVRRLWRGVYRPLHHVGMGD